MIISLVKKVLLTLIIISYSTSLLASKPLKLTIDKIQQQKYIKAEKLAHHINGLRGDKSITWVPSPASVS